MIAAYGAHDLAIGERDALMPAFSVTLNVAAPLRHTESPALNAYVTEQTTSPFPAKVTLSECDGNYRGEGSFAITLGVHTSA
jgi:hypothetical protein